MNAEAAEQYEKYTQTLAKYSTASKLASQAATADMLRTKQDPGTATKKRCEFIS